MAVEKVQSEGKICVLDVEVKGVQNIKETDLNAKFFFVQPPDMEALVRDACRVCIENLYLLNA